MPPLSEEATLAEIERMRALASRPGEPSEDVRHWIGQIRYLETRLQTDPALNCRRYFANCAEDDAVSDAVLRFAARASETKIVWKVNRRKAHPRVLEERYRILWPGALPHVGMHAANGWAEIQTSSTDIQLQRFWITELGDNPVLTSSIRAGQVSRPFVPEPKQTLWQRLYEWWYPLNAHALAVRYSERQRNGWDYVATLK